MKKRIAIVTMALMSLFAISAFAQGFGMDPSVNPRMGRGYGGYHMNGGYMMNGGHPCWGWGAGSGYAPEVVINNEAEAKKVVQDFVTANLKGYKVGDVAVINTYRGQEYFIYATDASGNDFTFMTGLYGGVRGPIAGKIMPQSVN